MNLHLLLLHRLFCYFYENPNKDYFGILEDMEIINLLIDVKLIELIAHVYICKEDNLMSIYIKVTPKGLIFINSYNNIF